MPKTRRELIDQTIDKLGVLIPGQAPSDESVSKVDRILDPLVAMMAALDIYYLPDIGTPNPPNGGEVPDEAFLPIADKAAWASAGSFNQADSASLKVLNDQADIDLRMMSRPARTRQTLSTDWQLRGMRNVTYSSTDFRRGT
jgi:hypothetical protein